jgi:hypothetical protein
MLKNIAFVFFAGYSVREAHCRWKESLLQVYKTNLNRLEAIKKKSILAAKYKSLSDFTDNLGSVRDRTVGAYCLLLKSL